MSVMFSCLLMVVSAFVLSHSFVSRSSWSRIVVLGAVRPYTQDGCETQGRRERYTARATARCVSVHKTPIDWLPLVRFLPNPGRRRSSSIRPAGVLPLRMRVMTRAVAACILTRGP